MHKQNFIDADKLFDATLDPEYRPINSMNMARVLAQYPVITLKVVVVICSSGIETAAEAHASLRSSGNIRKTCLNEINHE